MSHIFTNLFLCLGPLLLFHTLIRFIDQKCIIQILGSFIFLPTFLYKWFLFLK